MAAAHLSTTLHLLLLVALSCPHVGASSVSLPLQHFNINGELTDGVYLDLELGAPTTATGVPQTVSVLIDTGSQLLAVPSKQSVCYPGCPRTEGGLMCSYPQCAIDAAADASNCVFGAYDPALSNTAVAVLNTHKGCCNASSCTYQANQPLYPGVAACAFAAGYGGVGETVCELMGGQGYMVQDTLKLGGMSATVILGTTTQLLVGFQEPPVAGIMGVGPGKANCFLPHLPDYVKSDPTDVTCFENALTALLKANNVPNQFGMCMGNAKEPGTFVLGDPDTRLSNGAAQQATLALTGGNFGVTVLHMTINGNSLLSLSEAEQYDQFQGTILDSGTSFLSLTPTLYTHVEHSGSHLTCSANSDCDLVFTLQGATQGSTVTLRAPGILACLSGRCQKVAPDNDPSGGWMQNGGQGNQVILGYVVLRNYYTTFQRDTSINDPPRVTFAQPSYACYTPLPDNAPSSKGNNNNNNNPAPSSGSNLSGGAVAGIVIGCLAFVALCFAAYKAHADKSDDTERRPHRAQDLDEPILGYAAGSEL